MGRAWLQLRDNGTAEWIFDLVEENTRVGRHPNSNVQVLDRLISKEHLRIVRNGDGHVLYDCNSLNGTRINGEKVEMAKLNSGDVIEFGGSKAVYMKNPANPKACPIIERTGDGVVVGRCFHHCPDGECPRHGDVRGPLALYRETGKLTDERDFVRKPLLSDPYRGPISTPIPPPPRNLLLELIWKFVEWVRRK